MNLNLRPLERVWKVLFRPLNLLTKAPAILGEFHSVSPQIWGPGGLLKQALRKALI